MKQKAVTPEIMKCHCGADARIMTWEVGQQLVYRVECTKNHSLSNFCGTWHRAICKWNNRVQILIKVKGQSPCL